MAGDLPAGLAAGDVFQTTFFITPFAESHNNAPKIEIQTSVDGKPALDLTVGKERFDLDPSVGVDDCYAFTVNEVMAFRFHTDAGWPGLRPLAGVTLPLRVGVRHAMAGQGPFATNVGEQSEEIRAYRRLIRTADWRGSFVRLSQAEANSREWWLSFRLPYRTPLLGDAAGILPVHEGGIIDNRLIRELPTFAINNGRENEAPHPNAVAEARSGGSSRMPCLVGVLSRSTAPSNLGSADVIRANLLESIAVGAGALAVQASVVDLDKDEPTDDIDRIALAAAMADGFWWWKRLRDPTHLRDHRLDPTLNFAALGKLLSGDLKSTDMPSYPPNTDLPTGPVVTALTATSPAWLMPAQAAFPAEAPLLERFGLKAAATAAPLTPKRPDDPSQPPFHYLHPRMVNGTFEGAAVDVLEWRRWVGLECAGAGAPVPVLVRVRPGTPAGAIDAPDAANLHSRYTVRFEGLTDAHVLGVWSTYVAGPARAAAADAEGARHPSLAPDLIGAAPPDRDPGYWVLELDCREPATSLELGPSQVQPPLDASFIRRGRLFKTSHPAHKPGGVLNWFATAPVAAAAAVTPTAESAELQFAGLRTHDGAPLRARSGRVSFTPAAGKVLDFEMTADGPRFADHEVDVAPRPTSTPGPAADLQTVAVGALDLVFDRATAVDGETGLKLAFPQDPSEYDVVATPPDSVRREGLAVREVRVGGADDDERPPQSQSLVWAARVSGRAYSTLATDLRLALRDHIPARGPRRGRRQTTLALRTTLAWKPTVDQAAVVVLDREPMAVAKVTVAGLSTGDRAQDVLATWETPEAVWRMPDNGRKGAAATLTLPPQGYGEAWERRKATTPNPSDYLPPDQVDANKVVPAVLTPPARFRFETEERARNPAAAWNLRRLFADPETDLPGVQLLAIETMEALYGLEARDTPTPGIRLAELAAWRGTPRNPPEPLGRDPTTSEAGWQKAADLLAGRLAMLDARRTSDLMARPIIPDVNFRLRPNGRYVQPAKSAKPTALIAWTPSDKGGILGGALAGFEDVGLIAELLSDSERGRGSIEGLQLSAIGAWTRPLATFNKGLTRISAAVEGGRTTEARFERLGRLGILRTKAKHVIVYRRAFLPSRQFVTDQEPHLGRPIVRKVEEYIEITQPVRGYPDAPGATAMEAGPILACRFRTIRIPVHGSWRYPIHRPGETQPTDDNAIGYALPLWREGSDPAVYPKPHAEVLTAGEGAVPEPDPRGQRIDNIADLVFYTLYDRAFGNQLNPDTDLWPNVYGVDFGDEATDDPVRESVRAKRPISAGEFADPKHPDRKLKPAAATTPAFSRYTLRLEPGAAANLTIARAEKAVMAQLHTVTLMRATTAKPKDDPSPTLKLPKALEAGRAEVRDQIQAWLKATPNGALGTAAKNKLLAVIDGELTSLGDGLVDARKAANKTAAKACGLAGQLAGQADAEVTRVDGVLEKIVKALATASAEWSKHQEELSGLLDQAQVAVGGVQPPGEMAREVLSNAVVAAQNAITQYAATAKVGLKATATDLSDRLTKAEGQLEAWLDSARDAVTAATNVDASKFDLRLARTAASELRQTAAKLSSAAAEADRAATTVAGLGARIAEKIDPISRPAGGQVRATTAEFAAMARVLADMLRAAERVVRGRTALIEKAIDAVQAGVDNGMTAVKARLDQALEALRLKAGSYGDEALEAARQRVEVLAKEASGALIDIEAALGEVADRLKAAIDTLPPTPLDPAVEAAVASVSASIGKLRARVDEATAPPELAQLQTEVQALRDKLALARPAIDATKTAVCDAANSAVAAAQRWLDDQATELVAFRQLIAAANAIDPALRTKINAVVDAVDTAASEAAAQLRPYLEKLAQANPQNYLEDGALRILRAAGLPPEVANLAFNRDRLAYYFDETKRIVTTPVTALLDQAEAELRGVGMALPTLGIGDQLLAPVKDFFKDAEAAALQEIDNALDVDRIIRDLAGLKGLMAGLNMGERLGDAVKITHDVDVATRSAWIQGDLNYAPGDQDLFRISVFALRSLKPVLKARTRYERTASGSEKHTTTASLVSDIQMELGGASLVRVRDAAIRYDDRSGMRVDIRPEKIEFDGALQAIAKVLETFLGPKSPIKIEVVVENGRSVGLRARYDLPPTDLTGGAFTLLNVTLGVHLDLMLKSEFEIRAFAYLGRKASPFVMIITWLGGGGYLEAEAIYRPSSGSTDIAVAVSLGATAGTGFNFGPLRGKVQVYFGVEATYISRNAGSRLVVAGVIVVNGSVSAWGIVTVYLCLTLSLSYSGGNQAQGQGNVSVSVEISRFFKLNFSSHLTYTV